MSECQHCARKAQLFLCGTCIVDLREILHGLAARWLPYLSDSALGQTKLGSSERRTPRYRQPLDGESSLASQIEPFPNERETDLVKARMQRQQAALQHALGAARINLAASEKLDYARCIAVEWIRDICETRGAEVPSIVSTANMLRWLAANVSAIAAGEDAGLCYREFKELVGDIERIINRPVPLVFYGPCPAAANGDVCGADLSARRGAAGVKCWKCKAEYRVDELIAQALERVDELLYSAREVQDVMAQIGLPIPSRTWRSWCSEGRIQVRGWRGAEPMYWLKDAKELLANKPQKVATGAAARRAG